MRTRIKALVFQVVDDINEAAPPEIRLRKSEDAVVTGDARELDSLGVVMLIAGVESAMEGKFNVTADLNTDSRISGAAFGDLTLGTLIDHLERVYRAARP